MDTLSVVRKIREAEALADAGNYAEARRGLQSMLTLELTGAHRQLVTKKLQLFEKQQTRRTGRINAAEDRESKAATVVRKPRAEQEQPTAPVIASPSTGIPTEVVPQLRDTNGSAGRRMPGLSDSQELSPIPDTLEPRKPAADSAGTDRHFGGSLRRKPTTELKDLAEKLPEGDVRRELALEILKLRNEVDRFRTDRLSRMARPSMTEAAMDMAETRVPSRAPASDVHLPSRDEEAEDLKVLRRDTVRSSLLPNSGGSNRVSIREYVQTDRVEKPANYRLFAIGALAATAGILLVWIVVQVLRSAFSGGS